MDLHMDSPLEHLHLYTVKRGMAHRSVTASSADNSVMLFFYICVLLRYKVAI